MAYRLIKSGNGMPPAVVPRQKAGARCPYCRRRFRRLDRNACERCGSAIHYECLLAWMLPGERAVLEETEQPFVFICHGCRD